MKNTMKTLIPLAILCLMFSSFSGCHKETEQDKVKKVITSLRKAAEEKDIKKFGNSISKTYNDSQGNTYGSIKGLLIAYFYQYPKISMYITKLNVSVTDTSAEAVFRTVLTSRGADESTPAVLPESLGVYAFDVFFKKESNEWKVVSAEWERVGDAEKP
jgi:hypothetical protein